MAPWTKALRICLVINQRLLQKSQTNWAIIGLSVCNGPRLQAHNTGMDPTQQTKPARVDNGAQTSTGQASSIPNNATARIDNAPGTRSGIMSAVEVIQVQTPQGTVTAARATVVPTQPGLASGASTVNPAGESVTRATSTLPTGTKNSDIPSTQTLVGAASIGLQSVWHQHAGQHRPHQAH
jgi:hypothetical protein